MSSECYNRIKVKGPKAAISRFKMIAFEHNYKVKGEVYECTFLIDRLYPCPIEQNSVVTSNVDTMNDWHQKNWGTLGVYPDCIEIEDTDNTYDIKIYSVYGPPLLAFNKISADFPELLFEICYWGICSGFCGDYRLLNGEVLSHECYEGDEYDAMFEVEEHPADLPKGMRWVGTVERIR